MRPFLGVCVLIVFATLASADGLACPDGCQAATSTSAADHCNASGSCVFCTGALVMLDANPVAAPTFACVSATDHEEFNASLRSPASVEHPPRLV